MKVLSPVLPARTRWRMRAIRLVDITASWLAAHGHPRAAVLIWKACRLW